MTQSVPWPTKQSKDYQGPDYRHRRNVNATGGNRGCTGHDAPFEGGTSP